VFRYSFAAFFLIAFVAGNAGAAPQLTGASVAPVPSGGGYCPSVPPSSTSFLTTSSQVWFVFTYNGGSSGDQYVVQWVSPTSVVYTSNSFTQTGNGGSYGYQYYIPIAGSMAATLPGTWHVQLLWNSNVISRLAFTISLASSLPALQVSPTSVSGSGSIGSSVNLTGSSPVSVSSSNSTSITFSVSTQTTNSTGPNWLSVSTELTGSRTTGTTPATLFISANLQGFAAGTYTGTVTVTPTSATSNGAQTIGVTVQAFGQDSLQITYSPNVNQTLQLTSPSAPTAAIQVTASASNLPGMYFNASATTIPAGGTWLNIVQNGFQTNTSVSVSARAGGLPQGTYNGRVDLVDTNGDVTSAGVTLIVAFTPPSSSSFVPITPCRIADTRNPLSPFGGPSITGGTSRSFAVPNSSCGIPATATAFSLNVTVVPSVTLGYLTLWPSGQAQPVVSTMNSFDGRIKANAAIVSAGNNGAVSVYVSDTTDVILDIIGYFVPLGSYPGALAFYPLPPCRVADTRNAAALLGGPSLAATGVRSFPILASPCGTPATAQAYSLNFTAVPPAGLGYLTVWPDGQPQPLASSLNDPTGTITANAVIVPAPGSGAVDVFATDNTNLVIDSNGYFASPGPGGLSLYTIAPCRVLDTRMSPGTPITSALSVPIGANPCNVPAAAQAFVLNATVVPTGPLGFLTLWPLGQAQPLVSTLNAPDGAVTSNMAIVPSGGGFIMAFASNPTHLILDITGYFAP